MSYEELHPIPEESVLYMQKKISILLVDTDKNVCSSYCSVLEKERDMNVVAKAKDIESANQALKKLKPDIIVIDANLVDLNGNHQLSQCIIGIPDVRVLVVSFHSDSRFVIRMLHAGASGYMLKDRAGEELAQAIHTIVSNKTYISPGIAGIA